MNACGEPFWNLVQHWVVDCLHHSILWERVGMEKWVWYWNILLAWEWVFYSFLWLFWDWECIVLHCVRISRFILRLRVYSFSVGERNLHVYWFLNTEWKKHMCIKIPRLTFIFLKYVHIGFRDACIIFHLQIFFAVESGLSVALHLIQSTSIILLIIAQYFILLKDNCPNSCSYHVNLDDPNLTWGKRL